MVGTLMNVTGGKKCCVSFSIFDENSPLMMRTANKSNIHRLIFLVTNLIVLNQEMARQLPFTQLLLISIMIQWL